MVLSNWNVLLQINPLMYTTEVSCFTDPWGRCPISPTDISFLRFRFLLHGVWSTLQLKYVFSCPHYCWQWEKQKQSCTGSELVQCSFILHVQCQCMTQKGVYDLSSGSPWLIMYSHLLSYCFKLTLQSHYCKKEKHKKHTHRVQCTNRQNLRLFLFLL